jgi:hypothetical protein
MALAGHVATVSLGGTPTTMTNQAMSGAGVTYQVTDPLRQVVDPATTIQIFVGGVAQATSSFTFDYLTGTVTFGGAPGAAVTITGKFIPLRQITTAYEASASLSKNLADTSLLGTGFRLRLPTMGDIAGTMSCYDNADTTYTDIKIIDRLVAGEPILINFLWTTGKYLRFWALASNAEVTSAPDDAQAVSYSFEMDTQTALTMGTPVEFSIAN